MALYLSKDRPPGVCANRAHNPSQYFVEESVRHAWMEQRGFDDAVSGTSSPQFSNEPGYGPGYDRGQTRKMFLDIEAQRERIATRKSEDPLAWLKK